MTKPRWFRGAALSAVIALGLGGCSSLPDWANPVDWYDSAFNTDGTTPPASGRKVAENKSDKSFPSLKSVPARAPSTSTGEQRAAATSGLIADRNKAKYTDDDLRSGGKAASQLASAQKAPVATAVKKPVAQIASAAPRPVAPALVSAAPMPTPVDSRYAKMPKLASATAHSVPSVAPAPLPPLIAPSSTASRPAAIAATPPPAPLPGLISPAAPAPVQLARQGYGTRSVAPSFPNAGQNALSEIFAAALAQSASTVTTAPANSRFTTPVARPINTDQSSLPGIVLAAYNDPLTGKTNPSVTVNPGVAVSSGTSVAVQQKKLVVNFSNGSAKLSRKAKKQLLAAAEAYKQKRQGVIRVVGHASHFTKNMNLSRHRMINFRVSLDRANEVARELMRRGVDATALRVEAVSDSDPIYYEHMPEGQAHNRRAEIFLEF